MSREMRDYLGHVVVKHGFETRMCVSCGNCGANTDLGPSYIVAKEDIEHNKDFEKFRSYRNLVEGGTTAYRRSSKASSGSQNTDTRSKKKNFFKKVGLKLDKIDTRSFMEKTRDFLENRYSYSLYIWPPNSK